MRRDFAESTPARLPRTVALYSPRILAGLLIRAFWLRECRVETVDQALIAERLT
jgi:hypothetical protein